MRLLAARMRRMCWPSQSRLAMYHLRSSSLSAWFVNVSYSDNSRSTKAAHEAPPLCICWPVCMALLPVP